jgi:uncharacterized UPF0160 family protein
MTPSTDLKTVITHSGRFHPDDVFAVAALHVLFEGRIKVIRTRDQSVINGGDFVVDVGAEYDPVKNRFDHHQFGAAGRRSNGVSYASFGLVWKQFGEKICGSKEVADKIDGRLVQAIDAFDNGDGLMPEVLAGVYPYQIDDYIGAFNLTWRESPEDSDNIFNTLVKMMSFLIKREIVWVRAELEAEVLVKSAYQSTPDKRIIFLEKNYPWEEIIADYPEPLFVIHPHSADNHWAAEAVRKNQRLFENRRSFPANWAGKRDGELAKISGVKDAIFCHGKRFIAYAQTREGALKLAEMALG